MVSRPTTRIICKNCNIHFDMDRREYNRQIRCGRQPDHFFCGLSCHCHHHNKHNMPKKGTFTQYLNSARRRVNRKGEKKPFDLDEQYLQHVWDAQGGKCAVSQIPIKLRTKGLPDLDTASLDRIDSNLGYVKGNVQFLALGINYAKNSRDDNTIKAFIKMIIEHSVTSHP